MWVTSFERWIDRVQRGAVYFVRQSLWTNENVDVIEYPISNVLRYFHSIITAPTTGILVIEIM